MRASLWKDRCIGFVVALVRVADRLVSPCVLGLLITPFAVAWSFLELVRFRPRPREFERLPVSWRSRRSPIGRFLRLWHHRTRLNASKALSLIPDRLDSSRWSCRIVVHGTESFDRLRAEGRPILLITLHFGPMALWMHWLRSRRIATAALVDRKRGSRPYRLRLNRAADRSTGLEGIPRLILVDQIWDLREFLQPGRVLVLAIDGDRGRSSVIGDDELAIRLATGPLTLAKVTGAAVIPCLMVAEPGLRIAVHFGEPIADRLLTERDGHAAALRLAIQAYRPVLRHDPEQCSWELLRRITPCPPAAESGPGRSTTVTPAA